MYAWSACPSNCGKNIGIISLIQVKIPSTIFSHTYLILDTYAKLNKTSEPWI